MSEQSNHFCIMPFVHLGTKPDGVARLCCMAPTLELEGADGQKLRWGENTLAELWNSPTMRQTRLRMLSGEQIPECKFCWDEEAAGKRSKRQTENRKWSEEAHRFTTGSGVVAEPPIYFDLRLGNLCNLKCRSCNSLFSSEIKRELDRHETEWAANPGLNEWFGGTHQRAKTMTGWFDDAGFWTDFETNVANFREIYISGGEPSINRGLIGFLERCASEGYAKNIRVRFNTNLTNTNGRFIDALAEFGEVRFGASVDAYGARNEWLRNPSNWEKTDQNIRHVIALGGPFRVDVNCTVSLWNVPFLDALREWVYLLGHRTPFNIDVVHQPSFMQIRHLPDGLKDLARDNLGKIIIPGHTPDHEQKSIEALITGLDDPRDEDQWRLALQHARTLDRWRGENFLDIFPEFRTYV